MIKEALEFLTSLVNPLAGDPIENPDGSASIPFRGPSGVTQFLTRPGPERLSLSHRFHDLSSMAAWLRREVDHPEKADVLICATDAGLECQAILGHGIYDYEVSGVQRKHPLYQQWMTIKARPWSQQGLYSALRPLVETIIQADGMPEGASPGASFHFALRKMSVAKGSQYEAEVNRLGAVVMTCKSGTDTLSVTLPETFVVQMPMYRPIDGTEVSYPFRFVLGLDLSDAEPSFSLTCPELELVQDTAIADAIEIFEALLGADFLVCRGELNREIVRAK